MVHEQNAKIKVPHNAAAIQALEDEGKKRKRVRIPVAAVKSYIERTEQGPRGVIPMAGAGAGNAARTKKEPQRRGQAGVGLLASRALIESGVDDQRCKVVQVQAVAHARHYGRALNRSDIPIAVVVAGNGGMQDANRIDFAVAANLNNQIAIVGLAAISIVHCIFPLGKKSEPNKTRHFNHRQKEHQSKLPQAALASRCADRSIPTPPLG